MILPSPFFTFTGTYQLYFINHKATNEDESLVRARKLKQKLEGVFFDIILLSPVLSSCPAVAALIEEQVAEVLPLKSLDPHLCGAGEKIYSLSTQLNGSPLHTYFQYGGTAKEVGRHVKGEVRRAVQKYNDTMSNRKSFGIQEDCNILIIGEGIIIPAAAERCCRNSMKAQQLCTNAVLNDFEGIKISGHGLNKLNAAELIAVR